MAGNRYRVLIYDADETDGFSVSTLICEFQNPKNIGYARYLSDVGEAFFTIMQDDPKLSLISRAGIGKYHIKILRNNLVVWRGILSEYEGKRDDVVFYAYGYEGCLFWLDTTWGQSWADALIGDDIVTDLWIRAKTGLTGSQLGFVTTGTINNPVTTSGGSTSITLPKYRAYFKRILYALKEMVNVSTGNTTNTVFFEIAYPTDPTDNSATFNFYKNRSDDTDYRWIFPVHIEDFDDQFAPLMTRNQISAVASGPRNQVFRSVQIRYTGDRGVNDFGRRAEPIYLQWVRDQTSLDNVAKARLHRALRDDTNLVLKMRPDKIMPVDGSGTSVVAGYKLGDTVRVKIDRGITNIEKRMFLQGMQVISIRGVERCYPMLSDRNPS